MNAALIFQPGISALAGNHESDFLETADAILVERHHLGSPAAALGIFHIHPVNLGREKSRLISACAGTDLHDNVFVIVGILRQKQDLQLVFQLGNPFLRIGKLFLQKFLHLLVGLFLQHHQAFLYGFFTFFIFFIRIHNGSQLALLFHELLKPCGIVYHGRFT